MFPVSVTVGQDCLEVVCKYLGRMSTVFERMYNIFDEHDLGLITQLQESCNKVSLGKQTTTGDTLWVKY